MCAVHLHTASIQPIFSVSQVAGNNLSSTEQHQLDHAIGHEKSGLKADLLVKIHAFGNAQINQSVDQAGASLPLPGRYTMPSPSSGGLSNSDRRLLVRYLTHSRRVLEWGMGESTKVCRAMGSTLFV